MAQFYTLEEAARVLGMNPEDLKAKAQHREVRAFLDGGSWRFRVVDIDELARRRGLGSDAELRLSDLDIPAQNDGGDIDISEFQMGVVNPEIGGETMDLGTATGDHDILLDDLSLPPSQVSGSSSVIIGMGAMSQLPSASDVRLVPDLPKGASDSDVKLFSPVGVKKPSDSDVTLVADDTASHGILTPGSGDTAVRQSPVPGSSAAVVAGGGQVDADSDFELTPSSVIDALQPDTGSDFELTALEGSDEFESTPMLRPSDSDVTAADPGLSGINLSRPSDSGINLQMASGLNLGAPESIELAPLSGDEIKQVAPRAPQPKAPPAKAPPAKIKPSLAETPPPSARKGDKDIFDDTDFEVDALDSDIDSDDKTMQLDAASDFELEESDTGSEVFAIDEEDVDHNAATAMGPAVLEEDEEEDDFGAVAAEEIESAWDVESEPSSAPAGRAPATVLEPTRGGGASAEWGGIWVGLLMVATVFMLFLAFVSMDLVRNLYDFRGDSPASGIVKSIAGLLG
jgi:hypothetical protein